MSSESVTALIKDWQGGDRAAFDKLLPLVYDELRRLARRHMRAESTGHTLQATALVNEAFLRLANLELNFDDRSHFMAMASRTMRRILVDHARAKKSVKRGGGLKRTTFVEDDLVAADDPAILDLDRALDRLEQYDEQLSQSVELVFFGGLSYAEAADIQNISKTKFFENLQFAKAWLHNQMGSAAGIDPD